MQTKIFSDLQAELRFNTLAGLLSIGFLFFVAVAATAQAKFTGTPGVATSQAVVNFSDLASEEMLHPSPKVQGFEGGEIENKTMPRFKLPPDAIVQAQKTSLAQGLMPIPTSGPQVLSPTTALSFQAAPDNNLFIPPDTNGAVGPNHLMVTLNGTVKIQNRAGGQISSVTLHNFWASVVTCNPTNPTTCESDPKIVYDPYGGRWIFATGANFQSANSEILIGVSQTSDPTGNWNLYMVRADPTGINAIDFTELGFNKDWIGVTYNMFNVSTGNYAQANVYVFNKANLYAHLPANFTLFTRPPDQAFALAPAVTYDNTLSTLYILQDFNGNFQGFGFLQLLTITGPVGSETLTVGPFIPTPNPWDDFAGGVGDFAPQLGSTTKINTFDARLTNLVYRNGSLWTAQHIFLPSGAPNRAAVQWWQLGTDGSIQQLGRIDDSSGTLFRTFPSIAVNKNNDALIGYSLFSSSMFASAAYSFHAHTDPVNTVQSENVLKAGLASYVKFYGGNRNRWGDFSYSQVDPVDDINLWTIQEYADTPSNLWATWWGEIALATHFFVNAPATVTAGSPFSVTVTAQDASNNTVGSYTGTVHFTATGSSAVPPDYTFLPGDNGVHTFTNGFTLNTAGGRIVTATDTVASSVTGTAAVTVNNAAATKYSMNSPPTATAGVSLTVGLVAQDQFNNTAKNYTGRVHFTTTDPSILVMLPADYTYLPGDNGQKIFTNGFTLQTVGAQSITARDTVTASITATNPITVTTDAFITPQGKNVRMFRTNVKVVVASFTDVDLAETGLNFTATIDWGDGNIDNNCTLSSTICKIVRVSTSPNTFNVMGAHSYRNKRLFTVQVGLMDSGGSQAVAFSTARFFPINSSR